jgi:hypothetical protein
VKFEIVGSLLYSEISVFYESEKTLLAMIDTGSAGTVADIDKFNIDPHRLGSRIVDIVGVGGRQEVLAQTVSKLGIGGVEVANYEIQFCDLWNQFKFEAIIGSDLLEKLGAIIDYPAREIVFTKSLNEARA